MASLSPHHYRSLCFLPLTFQAVSNSGSLLDQSNSHQYLLIPVVGGLLDFSLDLWKDYWVDWGGGDLGSFHVSWIFLAFYGRFHHRWQNSQRASFRIRLTLQMQSTQCTEKVVVICLLSHHRVRTPLTKNWCACLQLMLDSTRAKPHW